MMRLVESLRRKGWSEEDIKKTLEILNSAPKTKPSFFYKIVYWIALIAAVIGNLFVAIILVPLLLLFNHILLYLVIAFLGVSFGALFNSLLTQIESFGEKTYIVSGLFIPALAFINMFFMVQLINIIITTLKVTTMQPSFLVAIVYGFLFLTPYLITKIREQVKIIV